MLCIKERRRSMNMTQVELADEMGVSQNVISNWEHEICLPRTRELPRLAHVLCCSISELFVPEEDEPFTST